MPANIFHKFFSRFGDFKSDERGNVVIITALMLVPLVGGIGYGIDYTRAVGHKLRLDSATNAATLAGMDTARALLLADPNMTTADLKAAADARARQVFAGLAPKEMTFVLKDVQFVRVGETVSGSMNYTATFPTTFANVVGLNSISFEGSAESQVPLDPPKAEETGDPNYLTRERFDKAGIAEKELAVINGDYNGWATGKAGVEIGHFDKYLVNGGTPRPPGDNTFVAELDSTGNSSISKKIYLPTGAYQVRYYYASRIPYPVYDPLTICGTKPVDVDWANATVSTWGNQNQSAQTNRIGVYLDPAPTDIPPQYLSDPNNNMIDVCVSSLGRWIERNVNLNLKASGFYWLSFQAEGADDGQGGLIADIRLCKNACPGAVASAPFPWAHGTVLFRDNLELPPGLWPADYFTQYQLNNSGAATPESKWAPLPPGWTTSPVNQIEFKKENVGGVAGYVLPMDSTGGAGSNKAIHRKFLLPPGLYAVHWDYSTGNDLGAIGNWCGLGGGSYSNAISQVDALRSDSARPADTNIIGLYVDNHTQRMHPVHGLELGTPVRWMHWLGWNWNGARVPFHRVDSCVHSSSPSSRRSLFHILKTGYY